ncbi:MAG: exodeoxyribonuclease V subunit gamma [Nitriliruptor sp.]
MLHVHHADRADALVGALASVLRQPPADAFAPEVVAVHSRGIERWIAQRLSHHLGTSPDRGDGVAANVRFPFPGALVGDAVARATGTDPQRDPWRPERLVWPLLDVVDEAVREGRDDLLGPLRSHVADADGRPSDRRLGAVRRVTDLFDRYAVHRPSMLRAWADRIDGGDDPRLPAPLTSTAPDVGGDGLELAERYRWQPQLWRAVHRRLPAASGPERLAEATAALARSTTVGGDALTLDLPDRVAIFGVTALSASTFEVLAALATGPTPTAPDGRDVHVFLLHPSPALWRRTAERLAERGLGAAVPATAATALPTRDSDPTRDLPRDPLLTAWARDTRELQVVVSTTSAQHHDAAAPGTDPSHPDAAAPVDDDDAPTLLRRLQEAVHDDLPRDAAASLPLLARDDRTVQLHRCHGAIRQVEVLRDVLLHLLADDPTLEPRDVVVLCPDIETYAPLVTAVFGAGPAPTGGPTADGPVELRVQLADRSLRRTNPLLRVVAELLDLAAGRVTGSQILDLCTRAPIRHRFGLDEDDLGQLESWLDAVAIRWGFDEDHRHELGVPTGANTWRTGLDRILVGVTTADEQLRTAVGVTPEDEVEGDAVELAGRFAELLDRLHDIVLTLRTPRPVGAWLDALGEAVERLCATGPDDGWQQVQLERVFREVRDAVTGTPGDAGRQPLSLSEVRQLLGDRLEGAPSRAAHRTGDLTVCTLVPMRSVPHRVVVLLGMDDEVFPRRTTPDGDDLLAATPLVGDRDPRSEDRQLLLDALLATGDHLVVLTDGHDVRTGDTRPPAVPIGELLDVIDRTVATDLPQSRDDDDGPRLPASAAITVDHPLQPFDADRFRPGGLGHPGREVTRDGGPFGFDRVDLAAAEAFIGDRRIAPPFLEDRLAPIDDGGPLELRDLARFLHHPLQALLEERLDVRFPRDGEQRSDALPIELRGLSNWQIGDRLLAHALAGRSPDRWLEVETGRGSLPPGDLRDGPVADILRTVELFADLASEAGVRMGPDTESVAVDLELPGGHRLRGSVAVIGHTRVAASYSRLSRKARLSAWVDVLALTAARPEHPWCAVTLGRAVYGAKAEGGEDALASLATLRPGPPRTLGKGKRAREIVNPLGDPDSDPGSRRASAIAELESLVALRDRGLCGPLLLPCDTAGAYAETSWGADLGLHRRSPFVALRNEWETGDGAPFPREDADHAHQLLLGELTAEDLLELPPTEEEDGEGWARDEPSLIGRLGRRVWWPLLAAEEVRHR